MSYSSDTLKVALEMCRKYDVEGARNQVLAASSLGNGTISPDTELILKEVLDGLSDESLKTSASALARLAKRIEDVLETCK